VTPRISRTVGSAALVSLLFPLSITAQDKGPQTATLVYKSLPKWNLILPKDQWAPVGMAFPIAHANSKEGFAAHVNLMTLSIDADGDGKTETDVKGTSGYVELRSKTTSGKPLTYAARITNDGAKCLFAASGAMVGSLNGTAISIVDANNNGVYGEVGKDAIVVGNGRAASWLSKVVNLKDELFEIQVSADGFEVTAKPYVGETGTLELRNGFKSLGELDSIVVSDERGAFSFNVAQAKGIVVPVGSYKISGGFAHKANETAYIDGGKMRPIVVERGKTASLQWGGAVTAEFDFAHDGDKVTVQPNIKFFGRAGEEYYAFKPEVKSPKFFVLDGKKVVNSGRFGGC
jgi:hypothetical protein